MRALLALTVLAVAAAPASASFPGGNGPIVASVDTQCSIGADLVAYDAQTGAATPLTDVCHETGADSGATDYFKPDAAPDGQSVLAVYVPSSGPQGYEVIPIGGGPGTAVTLPDDLVGDLSAPSFSPGGTSFAAEGDAYENGKDKVPLFEVMLDGSEARQIRPAPNRACSKPKRCVRFEDPRWSPNGRWLLIKIEQASAPGRYEPGLWVVSAKTGRPIRRVSKHGIDGDWSPDSKRIVYSSAVRRHGRSHSALKVVGADGKHKRVLVVRTKYAELQPRWSPDGKQVAWVGLQTQEGSETVDDARATLWRVAVHGGKPKLVAKLPAINVDEGYFHTPEITWAPKP